MPTTIDTDSNKPHVLINSKGEVSWFKNRKEALVARHAIRFDECHIYIENDPQIDIIVGIATSPGDSPIEKMFSYEFSQQFGYFPPSQVEIGPYRVDFLVFGKIVVELDGHDYHSSKRDRTRDAKRDRYLQSLNYKVFRFTGSEIYADATACVKELLLSCQYSP